MTTVRGRPTPTVEDYLGAIYTLARDQESVIGRRLAEWLEVSAPTVTATIQRMIRDGWVTMAEDKTIHLTAAGNEAAISVLRRHMLTELLLAQVLGIPWSRVHEEADRLEHDLSPETAARVAELVRDAAVCPHGNPIPGHEDITEGSIPLLDAIPGRTYLLARVHEEIERDQQLMAFLEEHALIPGVRVEVVEIMPYNETVTLNCAGRPVVLGLSVARRIWLNEPPQYTDERKDEMDGQDSH